MTIKELKRLKKNLPSGWHEKLMNRLHGKYSKRTIYAVMRGEYNNDEIIDSAISLAEENKAMIIARKNKLRSL